MMSVPVEEAETYNALFVEFLYMLREYGVPASTRDLVELNEGLAKGLVKDLDDLFVFSRLVFVRRVEHMDAFERAQQLYKSLRRKPRLTVYRRLKYR